MTVRMRELLNTLINNLDDSDIKNALIDELSKNKSFDEMIKDATNANN